MFQIINLFTKIQQFRHTDFNLHRVMCSTSVGPQMFHGIHIFKIVEKMELKKSLNNKISLKATTIGSHMGTYNYLTRLNSLRRMFILQWMTMG